MTLCFEQVALEKVFFSRSHGQLASWLLGTGQLSVFAQERQSNYILSSLEHKVVAVAFLTSCSTSAPLKASF